MGKRLLKVLIIISFLMLVNGIYSMDELVFVFSLALMVIFLIIQYIIYGSINPLYLFQKKKF